MAKISNNDKKKETKETESFKMRARSGNPAKRGEVVDALKIRKEAAVAAPVKIGKYGVNPLWLIPLMVGLMVIGIAWVVIFYLTAQIGGYPIPALQYFNLVVGFVFIIVGFIFSTKWH